jgi:hypothetical protein
MKRATFHRRLTERLLPEWTGVDYVNGLGVSEPTRVSGWGRPTAPHRAFRAHHGRADLDARRKKIKTALDQLCRGNLDCKRMSAANRLLTTFAVLAEAERGFRRLNSELAAAARR